MKNLKRILALVLALLMMMSAASLAAEEATIEVDFSYSVDGVFWSEDLVWLDFEFYGEPGAVGDINTECYLPVYHTQTNQLVDIFHFPIYVKDAFSQGMGVDGRYIVTEEIRVSDPSLKNYRIKAIMLNSLETLSPEGSVYKENANEKIISNVDYPKFVTFDGIISHAPLHNNQTTFSVQVKDNVTLLEGALDAGYTEADFPLDGTISVTTEHDNLYKVQGLYYRICIRISEDGAYQLWWTDSIEGYNETVSVKPINLESADNGNGEAEYYVSEAATELSYLPLAESIVTYKNCESASYSDVVPGHSDYISEYRYTDTDMDGLFDTVYIVYEEVFMIETTNTTSYRIFADTDAMRTYISSSLKLDPEDSYLMFDMNVAFEELKAGQIVRLKRSTDGLYTYYDINISAPEIITGEVTDVKTIFGIERYKIGDTFYRMLTSNYNTLQVGDLVSVSAYDDIIVGYEILFNANVGIVLNTNMVNDFDTVYQVKILNQNGEVVSYNLGNYVNGSAPYYANNDALASAFPKGDMIVYELNDADAICTYDIQTGYSYLYPNVLQNTDKFTETTSTYRLSSNKLGSYYLTEDTLVFATDSTRTEIGEGNIILTENFIFMEDVNYSYSVLYNDDKEAIAVVLYETDISIPDENPDILEDIYYGIIVKTNFVEGFEPIYQIQLVQSSGDAITYQLAERVNGILLDYTTAEELQEAFPEGDMIAYQLNTNDELAMCDIESSYNGETTNVLDETEIIASGSATYLEETQAIGSYQLTDSTILLATSCLKEDISNDDVFLADLSQLMNGETYTYSVLADESNNVKMMILEVPALNIDSEFPLVITKTASIAVDYAARTKFCGYVNGEEMEFLASLNADATVMALGTGDIAFYTLNSAGEIIKARMLADKTDDGFVVIDNAMSGAANDTKQQISGNAVTLSTANYGTISTAEQAQTAAANMMSVGEAVVLKGFGAAGKAYQIIGNTLRLMSAYDYPETFDGTTERDYSNTYDEDRIQDYFCRYSTVAYLYNAKTGKFRTDSIFSAETDVNTFDYRYADQLENDDLIYVYNYDGETKLILIVDVKGDN